MDCEAWKTSLLQRKKSVLEFPFGPEVMVFKVMGRMFALLAWSETPLRLSLKCDPEHALVLREVYEAVKPGYHLSKKHWNTITLDGTVPVDAVEDMISQSYQLIVSKLKKADRLALEDDSFGS